MAGGWKDCAYRLRAALPAALVIVAFLSATPAGAASCGQLMVQLAATSAGSKTSARAIAAQERAVAAARAALQQYGCNGFLAAFRSQCSAIRADIRSGEGRLAAMKAPRPNRAAERTRILAAIERQGCNARQRTRQATAPRSNAARNETRIARAPRAGNLRTMCVRTCDGYYFPVAFGASAATFARDQSACETMCPGTAVQLYYHRLPGQESEDMVSAATGEPYSQLPNAFRYRSANAARSRACSCTGAVQGYTVLGGASKGYAIIGGATPAERHAAQGTTASWLLAGVSIDHTGAITGLRGSDAETFMAGAMPSEDERRIRVVGPAFLPDR